MIALLLLWGGTLGVIYTASYLEMSAQNRQMLVTHSNRYVLSSQENEQKATDDFSSGQGSDQLPADTPPSEDRGPAPNDSPRFQLSTFYTVALSYDGELLDIKNEQSTLHSDQELETLAQDIANGDKTNGIKDDLVFYKADKNGYFLVTFMDNTLINESASTLLHYTFLFGGVAIFFFLFISIYFSRKIVQPLEESYQKQKQFISDAGHELKTPVSVVNANAELLSREIGENLWLSNIRYENERMGTLVCRLLELTRMENTPLLTEQLDLSRLVSGEILPFESVAFEHNISFQCSITPDIQIQGNGPQIKQLVSILLDNAIQYTEKGSQISISLKKERSFARFSVCNPGKEIPPEKRSKLFDRFYRMDDARSSDNSETHYGLGLAIAKAIAESHKGRISVFCPDGLVEFRVDIPTL